MSVRSIVVALFAALLVLVTTMVALRWERHALSTALLERVDSRPDDQAAEAIARAVSLPPRDAIHALVTGLQSVRKPVFQAARLAIWTMVERWREIPPEESLPLAELLAERLATVSPKLLPPARKFADEVARTMLAWPVVSGRSSARLNEYCQSILSATSPAAIVIEERQEQASPDQALRDALAKLNRGLPPEPSFDEPPIGASEPAPKRLASRSERLPNVGDRLRTELSEPRRLDEDEYDDSETPPPGKMERPSSIRRIPANRRPAAPYEIQGQQPGDANGGNARPENTLRDGMSSSSNVGRSYSNSIAPSAANLQRGDLARWDSGDVARLLHSGVTSALGIEELERRGANEQQIELLRRATHPDETIRLQFVDAVSRATNLDSRAWLFYMASDVAPDVRLAALAKLATSSDAGLLREVERRARGDSDPRIAKIATMVSKLLK